MVTYSSLFDLQIMMFLLIAIGYFLGKKGIISKEGRQSITDLVIDVILPCNIVVSFMIEMNLHILTSCFVILLLSIGIQLFSAFAGKHFYPHADEKKLPVLRYGTLCSNGGFMGNALVGEIYGSQGLLYASIYLIPQRIVMWSAGISCFTKAKGKDVIKKVITHPCIVAVAIGLFFMLTQLSLPTPLDKTLRTLSGCTTSLSMLIIGVILSEIRASTIFSGMNLYYCFIRLIVFPALTLAVCTLLGLDSLVTAVSVVLAGMPAGTTTAILAAKYDGDAHFAVKCVFLSTLLSLITIPLWCMMMEWLL
ncbi:MAG: AEC family transporter [bacterium]|nr:AEC family transporter [bacterium]